MYQLFLQFSSLRISIVNIMSTTYLTILFHGYMHVDLYVFQFFKKLCQTLFLGHEFILEIDVCFLRGVTHDLEEFLKNFRLLQ